MTPDPRPPQALRLQEVAQLLRRIRHLDPEAQQELADLMEELARSLEQTELTAEEKKHLEESAAHLAHALHQQDEGGLLEAAKERLKQALLQAETRAPVATGIVRQIIDTLANLGI